jgi:cytidine deaminase
MQSVWSHGSIMSSPSTATSQPDLGELIKSACQARESAYAPFSGFRVGAALLSRSGRVFVGCNVENISFGLTICAERAAVCAAIAAGERDFVSLAVVADSSPPVIPCGACRQVLAEFAPALPICSANLCGDTYERSLTELLPRPSEGIAPRRCST